MELSYGTYVYKQQAALSRTIHSNNPQYFCPCLPRLCISRHVVADSIVIEETFNTSHGADSHVLIPQLPLSKAHNVLLRDSTNDTLDLFWAHAATGCDDLSSDIFCHSRGTVEGEED